MSRTEHRRLYKQIPSLKCKERCHDCCVPVPVSAWEASRLGISDCVTPTKTDSLECAFVGDSGCTVYERRPLMCRLFGTSSDKMLACPHGCCPNKKLTGTESLDIRDKYIKLIKLT